MELCPYYPGGTTDGIVTNSKLTKRGESWAHWGKPCGTDFIAEKFFEAHPEYSQLPRYVRPNLTSLDALQPPVTSRSTVSRNLRPRPSIRSYIRVKIISRYQTPSFAANSGKHLAGLLGTAPDLRLNGCSRFRVDRFLWWRRVRFIRLRYHL